MRGCFCLETSIGQRSVARFNAAGGRGAPGRRRVGAGELMGGRAQVHLGVMEDEVLEMDELAGKQSKQENARARKPSRSGLLWRRSSRQAVASSAAATADKSVRSSRAATRSATVFELKFSGKTTPWFLRRASRSPAALLRTQTPV